MLGISFGRLPAVHAVLVFTAWLAFAGLPNLASAATRSIPVVNQSFNRPDLAAAKPSYVTFWQAGNYPYGWIGSNSGVQYEANNPGAGFPGTTLPAPAQGTQVMWINTGGYAYQDVGSLASNTTYTLTVALGQPTDALSTAGPGIVALVNGKITNEGVVLAKSKALPAPAKGTFQDYILRFTTGPKASGDLTIELASAPGVTQTLWNNVRLTASAVPPRTTAPARRSITIGTGRWRLHVSPRVPVALAWVNAGRRLRFGGGTGLPVIRLSRPGMEISSRQPSVAVRYRPLASKGLRSTAAYEATVRWNAIRAVKMRFGITMGKGGSAHFRVDHIHEFPGFQLMSVTIPSLLSLPASAPGAALVDPVDGGQLIPIKSAARSTASLLPAPAMGGQVLWINTNGYACQNVGEIQPNTVYALSVALGEPYSALSSAGPGIISLLNGTDSKSPVLASKRLRAPARGTFHQYTLQLTTGGTASGDLTIELASAPGSTQTLWNNVRLTASPVPTVRHPAKKKAYIEVRNHLFASPNLSAAKPGYVNAATGWSGANFGVEYAANSASLFGQRDNRELLNLNNYTIAQVAMVAQHDAVAVLCPDSLEDGLWVRISRGRGTGLNIGRLGVRLVYRLRAENAAHQICVQRTLGARIQFLDGTNGNWVAAARKLRHRLHCSLYGLYRHAIIYKIDCDFPTSPKPVATFPQALDIIRRIAALTDNMKQIVYLVGWQYSGADTGYPSVRKVDKRLGGAKGLESLIHAAKKLNCIVSFHDNYTDAYKRIPTTMYTHWIHNPAWNRAIIVRGPNGRLLKGGIWGGGQSYKIDEPLYVSTGLALKRITSTIKRYGVRDTYHLDVLSSIPVQNDYDPAHPANAADFLRADESIINDFKKRGLNVTSEFLTAPFVGPITYFWVLEGPGDDGSAFKKQRPIPLAPFLYHGAAGYGGMSAGHGQTPLALLYGYDWSEDVRPTTPIKQILDSIYFINLPWQFLNTRRMENYQVLPSGLERVTYGPKSYVQVDAAHNQYRVVVHGSTISQNFCTVAEVSLGKWLVYTRVPRAIRLPKGIRRVFQLRGNGNRSAVPIKGGHFFARAHTPYLLAR